MCASAESMSGHNPLALAEPLACEECVPGKVRIHEIQWAGAHVRHPRSQQGHTCRYAREDLSEWPKKAREIDGEGP